MMYYVLNTLLHFYVLLVYTYIFMKIIYAIFVILRKSLVINHAIYFFNNIHLSLLFCKTLIQSHDIIQSDDEYLKNTSVEQMCVDILFLVKEKKHDFCFLKTLGYSKRHTLVNYIN